MPQLEYFLVSQDYAIDQFTNRVCIFNIVENIEISQFPNTMSVTAISAWNRVGGEEGQNFQLVLAATTLFPVTGERNGRA